MKNLYLLFIKFFKIGLFTFGGGYAMISLIQTEVVDNMKWIDEKEMINMIIIVQTTPGVLAVNTATFVGYRIAGTAGALCATLGAILPSIIVIGVISLFFDQFKNLKYVAYAFNGIRAGVVLLIAKAVVSLNGKNKKDIFYFAIIILTVALHVIFNINPIYILIASAVFGIIYSLLLNKGGNK